MEYLILNLEGVIVDLVYEGAVTKTKPTRSRLDPFEGGLFCAFLIFQNGVFLSVIVNEFKFAYLVCLSVLHNPAPISQLIPGADPLMQIPVRMSALAHLSQRHYQPRPRTEASARKVSPSDDFARSRIDR